MFIFYRRFLILTLIKKYIVQNNSNLKRSVRASFKAKKKLTNMILDFDR